MFGTNLGLLIGILTKKTKLKVFFKEFKNHTIPTSFAD